MIKLILNILVSGLAVFIADYLLPGVSIDSFTTAIILALVLGVINVTLKPFLKIITFPVNLMSLGLFSIILNGLLILLADNLLAGFSVDNLFYAIIFSVVLGVVNSLLSILK